MSFCSFFCCDTPLNEKEGESDLSEVEIRMFDTLPMQIKESNYSHQYALTHKTKTLFVDPEFLPNDDALGEYQHIDRKLIWKRIPDIVPSPCIYSHEQHTADSIMAVTTSGSHMKAALLSLAFKPERIHSIFGQQRSANPYGIYRLKVKFKGVLQWMTIDDCVPVFEDTGRPLLCGTVGNQIWMMLIFKAYAKICGSYSQIQSQDCFSVLNTFTPGPCFSYLLDPSIREDREATEQLFHSLACQTNSICVTTNSNPKFGLKSDYNYSVRSFKKGITELVGLGENQELGFKLTFDDIIQNCTEMAVSTNDPKCINGEQQHLLVHYNVPFFLTFKLEEAYSFILNFWREEDNQQQNFMRVAVARVVEPDRYSYVASKLEAYYNQMALDCPEMPPGTYKVMIMIKATKPKTAKVNMVCYRIMRGQFAPIAFPSSNSTQGSYRDLMKDVIADYVKKHQRKITSELLSSGSALEVHELYRKGGLGYVVITAGSKKRLRHLLVKIDKKEIENSHYEIIEPNSTEIIVLPLTSVGLTFLLKSLPHQGSSVRFPPGISIMEVF